MVGKGLKGVVGRPPTHLGETLIVISTCTLQFLVDGPPDARLFGVSLHT